MTVKYVDTFHTLKFKPEGADKGHEGFSLRACKDTVEKIMRHNEIENCDYVHLSATGRPVSFKGKISH